MVAAVADFLVEVAMSSPVYVLAVWSIVHGVWAEFVVSPDAAKVGGFRRLLAEHTATHVRVVRVERDDWDLIRPALLKLGVPPKSYTPREAAMFFDGWREVGRELDVCESDPAERGSAGIFAAVPVERRRRSVL